jgi:hypothetical protein
MAAPVSAFNFQLYYFETDKMVYEVGESIDMVAKVIADFGEGGYCYVSFALVTDLGPVYNQGYFIPSSPDVRFLSSSCVIEPNETSPGINGISAEVVFNYEICDAYSQSGTQVINVNLKKGPLVALPQSPLSVQFGSNRTFVLKIASTHNNGIPFSKEPISIWVRNSNLQSVLDTSMTTDSLGQLYIDWTRAMGPPGTYNLTLSSPGSLSFLPLAQSQPIIVEPSPSTLKVLNASNHVYCEFPQHGQAESLGITAEHLNSSLLPIDNSVVEWSTSFSSGLMTSLGNGHYGVSIPFSTGPGLYLVNLTATNDLYQTAVTNVTIECLPRPILANITLPADLLSGSTIKVEARVIDGLSSMALSSIPVTIVLSVNTKILANSQVITNSSGWTCIPVHLPESVWGSALASVTINRTAYHDSFACTQTSKVYFAPNVMVRPVTPILVGGEAGLSVCITDTNGNELSNVLLDLLSPNNETVAYNWTDSEGKTTLHWLIPTNAGLGIQVYSLFIHADTSLFLHQTIISVQLTVSCPLQLLCSNSTYFVKRDSNVTIVFTVELQGAENQTIDVRFRDSLAEITSEQSVTIGVPMTIKLSIGLQVSLGSHLIVLEVITGPYIFVGSHVVEVVVTGTLQASSSIVSAFYGENLVLNITAIDDKNNAVNNATICVSFADVGLKIILNGITTSQLLSVSLPLCVAPGPHLLVLQISQIWLGSANESIDVFVWMRTRITITVSVQGSYTYVPSSGIQNQFSGQVPVTAVTNSSGSIMSPPPILFNGNTSTESPTARETSLTSCPRFNSGTSNFSTVPAKLLTSASGNGHTVLNLRERSDSESRFSVMTSSTVLEEHPKETIPHSAFAGPETATSVRRDLLSRIFFVSLRINLS